MEAILQASVQVNNLRAKYRELRTGFRMYRSGSHDLTVMAIPSALVLPSLGKIQQEEVEAKELLWTLCHRGQSELLLWMPWWEEVRFTEALTQHPHC